MKSCKRFRHLSKFSDSNISMTVGQGLTRNPKHVIIAKTYVNSAKRCNP